MMGSNIHCTLEACGSRYLIPKYDHARIVETDSPIPIPTFAPALKPHGNVLRGDEGGAVGCEGEDIEDEGKMLQRNQSILENPLLLLARKYCSDKHNRSGFHSIISLLRN